MAKINKMIIGLIVLVGGVVTMIVLPSWGKWLADYPAQVAAGAPAYIGSLAASSAAATASIQGSATGSLDAINYVFVPIILKLADWVKMAGYGGGAFLALIGLFNILGAMIKTDK